MVQKGTTLLVTVGSTLFTSLTSKILSPSILSVLPTLGVTRLVVQYGATDLLSLNTIEDLELDSTGTGQFVWRDYNGSEEVTVEVFKYTDDFVGLVDSADAVISHAGTSTHGGPNGAHDVGSGSILTVLRSTPQKRLLVVPNTSLMDNHQTELATALETQGHLKTSTVE